jgi:SAM-dependent methyltransferase
VSRAAQVKIDFGKTASDYAQHRAGFPDVLFERLARFGIGHPGQRILDLGTGTGVLGRRFALLGCGVVGLDISTSLIAQARALDREAGVATRYVIARAEAVPIADRSFDVVAAGQCWHWLDRAKAAAEMRRLLLTGGKLVIAHFDWLPLPGSMVESTEKLIEAHNPKWKFGGGLGIHPHWTRDVAIAGFRNIETFSTDVGALYTHEAWRGRIRASAGVGASLSPEQVARFDTELETLLRERFPEDPQSVPHRVFAVVCTAP